MITRRLSPYSQWWSRAKWAFILFCVLTTAAFTHAQAESKHITIYTAQASFSAPVLDRNNIEYVGLIEALEPMGPVNARLDGKKWKFKFRDIEAQFETGKSKAKIRGKNIELHGPFLIENGHGLVPLSSAREVLPLFGLSPLDYHEAARRIFIGATVIRVTAKKADTGKILFTFSAPVNPFIATESGRLRMIFDHEPLQSDFRPIAFDDKLIPFATFSESNGSAELLVTGSAPMTASFSDDRKTITVSAVVQPPPPAPAPAAQATPPVQSATNARGAAPAQNVPPPKPRPFVIIDAAHGGSDRGASLGSKVAEKDVTLSVAHRLRHELEIRGISAILVRDGDATLTPDQRASIVNGSNAELYIGLHATAAGVGLRVFSSAIAPQTHGSLAFVPVQAAQASQVGQSRAVAVDIAQSLSARDMSVPALPGSIAPLNSIAIPAIMIEMSPREAGADELSTGAFQQFAASALAGALAMQSQKSHEVPR